jgi:hypothetical protein
MTQAQTTTQTTTQAQGSSMTQTTHTDVKAYRLHREGAYELEPFGPLMTLAQAQHYQTDMALGGFDVLVKHMGAV